MNDKKSTPVLVHSNNAPARTGFQAASSAYEIVQATQAFVTEFEIEGLARSQGGPGLDGQVMARMFNGDVVLYAQSNHAAGEAHIRHSRKVRSLTEKSGQSCHVEYLNPSVFKDLSLHVQRKRAPTLGTDNDTTHHYTELLRKAMALDASDIHIVLTDGWGFVNHRIYGELVLDKTSARSRDFYIALCRHLYNTRQAGQGNGNWQPGNACNLVDDIVIDGQPTRWRFHSYPNEDDDHAHVVLRRVKYIDNPDYQDISGWDGFTEAWWFQNLASMGYSEEHCKQLIRMFSAPSGGIYVCGKTCAGKTTLLDSALSGAAALAGFTRNVICIEDVPELSIPRAVRTPVSLDTQGSDNARGFVDAINSALRRDADTIVIGEIRAGDSGEGVKSAISTGHLVISTLHLNNLLGIPGRLEQLGIERNFVANEGNTTGFIWQRLLPTLCDCKLPLDPHRHGDLVERLRAFGQGVELDSVFIRNRKGCHDCGGRNPGLTVAAEILDEPNPAMRQAILQGDSQALETLWSERSKKRGFSGGVRALDHAFAHVLTGSVCPFEVEAALGKFVKGDDLW